MEHRDLVGREINVGDHVAYPTGSGSSKHMCVAQIVDIEEYEYKYWHDDKPQERWRVRLQPVAFNDYRSTSDWGYKDGKYQKLQDRPPRQVVVEKVENLVKVDLNDN